MAHCLVRKVDLQLAVAPRLQRLQGLQRWQSFALRTGVLGAMVALMSIGFGNQAFAEDTGLPVHGFADAGFGTSSSNTPAAQRTHGFSLGNVDLYLAPEFDDNMKSLLEIVFEAESETGEIVLDVERLQVGYTFNDALTLWVGRFHTPYGYWNTSFHHGAQFQTSVYRPRMVDFEDKGGILPAHLTGLWGKGQVRFEAGRLIYNAYVANAPRILLEGTAPDATGSLDMNMGQNDNDRSTVGGSASWRFSNGALEGLELGVHGLGTQVNSYVAREYGTDPETRSDVLMYGGFLVYDNHGVEVIGESYNFRNKNIGDANAETKTSSAGFVQAAYAVTDKVRPFARFEQTHLSTSDNYFAKQANGLSYTRYAGGVRYDVGAKAAIKFEWTQTNEDKGAAGHNVFNIWQTQYAIRF